MKNIYLVGFMGTGKTTVGKILATRLTKRFIEMDQIIQQQEQQKIAAIFDQKGEAYFRGLEKVLLKKISLESDLVVSCGGGLVCDPENLEIINNSGSVFCLFASPSLIFERIKNSSDRPLLKTDDPLAKIKELINLREPYYQKSGRQINTNRLNPDQVADFILRLLEDG